MEPAKPAFIPDAYAQVKAGIYDPFGFSCTLPVKEKESQAYHAATFQVNGRSVIFRKAKITPTKTGQFVTTWKRIDEGPTQPFQHVDAFDLLVIYVEMGALQGHFVFPKSVLLKQGIIEGKGSKGKRGMRVYPSWDTPTSKQALKTQAWQLACFVLHTKGVEEERVRELYARE